MENRDNKINNIGGKRALCVSGGGSKGAYAGGVIQHLLVDDNKDYDLYVGSSTGALMLPLVATNKITLLRDIYTNVTQDDIFKVNPFKVKHGHVSINFLNVGYNMIIRGKESFGDAGNLKKLIDKFITPKIYNNIQTNSKEIVTCVTNSTLATSEYKSSSQEDLEDFKDWLLASATVPPFMEYVKKGNYQYSDGGVRNPIPIQEAINRGATKIDVIVLRKEKDNVPVGVVTNPFQSIIRVADIMLDEIGLSDLEISKLIAKDKDVELNLFFTPRRLTKNSLIFNKEEMTNWWDLGFEEARKGHAKKVLIKSNN